MHDYLCYLRWFLRR